MVLRPPQRPQRPADVHRGHQTGRRRKTPGPKYGSDVVASDRRVGSGVFAPDRAPDDRHVIDHATIRPLRTLRTLLEATRIVVGRWFRTVSGRTVSSVGWLVFGFASPVHRLGDGWNLLWGLRKDHRNSLGQCSEAQMTDSRRVLTHALRL